MDITAFSLAQRFIGLHEMAGATKHNALVLGMLQLDQDWPQGDEVPWCSAFLNFVCWLLRLPRSKSLAARSWLGVGLPIRLEEARAGWDVVILSRGSDQAAGHVGLFAGLGPRGETVFVLGGNQADQVSIMSFWTDGVLGVRRLL